MNKRMREILAQIQAKTAEAKSFMQSSPEAGVEKGRHH